MNKNMKLIVAVGAVLLIVGVAYTFMGGDSTGPTSAPVRSAASKAARPSGSDEAEAPATTAARTEGSGGGSNSARLDAPAEQQPEAEEESVEPGTPNEKKTSTGQRKLPKRKTRAGKQETTEEQAPTEKKKIPVSR